MNQTDTEFSLDQLGEIYTRYEQDYNRAAEKASPVGKLLGLSDSPKYAACNDVFYEAVAQWTEGFCKTSPEPEMAAQALSLIIKAADRYRDTGLYWYCFAAQAHAEPLLDFAGPMECERLLRWYDGAYPNRDRMPVQKKLYKALKKRAQKC